MILLGSRIFTAGRLVLLPIVAIVLLPVLRAITIHYSHLPLATLRDDLYFQIHTHADGLAVGVLIAWVQVFHSKWVDQKRHRLQFASVLLAGGIVLYMASRDVFNFSALGMLFGAALLFLLHSTSSVLAWRGFYVTSRLSYGIYLNHFGVMPRVHSWFNTLLSKGMIGFGVSYALTFLICISIALFTFVLIEYPFLRLRGKWIKPVHHSSPVTVTQD